MAKLWFKFQRYFRRKPVRFFTFLVLYLTAGSLVFLHSGFVGQPAVSQSQASPAAGVPAEGAELPFLGDLHLGRGFRDAGEASSIARRYGPWFKGKDGSERAKLGDYGGAWSRALKGRIVREKEEERGKGWTGMGAKEKGGAEKNIVTATRSQRLTGATCHTVTAIDMPGAPLSPPFQRRHWKLREVK